MNLYLDTSDFTAKIKLEDTKTDKIYEYEDNLGRDGTTIVNTLAHELHIPLYDHHGKQHQIILPDYGRPANISKPKK